ncbi:PilX-like prepilin protein [Fluviicoccus keumensis]|uniref:PilX-like prepilin protein n=1 Tax=Fluviicoccus keumensis TaxID=1435465 RepID=A0A4Q7ZBW6_9GAMM|nr:PilX N-terminal domain-containing pilus assembly protein [Fluviicoccus keumensis]RZU47483.1 PilX-like prepilin protein [Fluviicoccus keumensis]
MSFRTEEYIRSPGGKQRGATLIVVMLVLVVLTVLGVSAMRMGLSNLNVATNSQVGNLLYQSSDAGLYYLMRLDPLKEAVPGGALAVVNLPGREDMFCMRMKGATPSLKAGVCDPAVTDDFMSGRNAVLTQVYVKSSQIDTAPTLGNDLDNLNQSLTMTSTAVLPAFGSATTATIKGCLALPGDDTVAGKLANGSIYYYEDPAVVSASECLTTNGAIFTTLVEDVQIVRELK